MKCDQCGKCCKLFLINLTEEEYNSKQFKTQFGMIDDFKKAESSGANIITQKEDGSCIYQEHNKCSIHNNRPQACQAFFCKSKNKDFKEMIKMIKNEK